MSKSERKNAMSRIDTAEHLANLHHDTPSDMASAHDQPKVKDLGGGKHDYDRKVEALNDSQGYNPCQISDYIPDMEWYPSPLRAEGKGENIFVSNSETILLDILGHLKFETVTREFTRAGPRRIILHNPKNIKAAIVTCGGLCPGLNTVIREIYITLKYTYGVQEIFGVPYGYRGFYDPEFSINQLTDRDVDMIHHEGGTILGSSRGGSNTKMITDAIIDFGFNMVFVIGGDGSHRGAIKIFEELKERKLPYAVIGVPKTIDNDIALIDRSFGFGTAVGEAQRAIKSAKTEAISAFNGIGLVKLMGRHSGHITMAATLASRDVDVCLIPEVHYTLDGEKGLLAHLKKVLARKGHCVVVVAEGAGVNLIGSDEKMARDASGNVKLPDVGLWLKGQITSSLKKDGIDHTLKYIDPTYMIRTVPPNAADNLYCAMLAQNAVHGAVAGYTGFTVGLIRTHIVYIPMEVISEGRIAVDVKSRRWREVVAATGQPNFEESVTS